MAQVITLSDQPILVPSKDFKHSKFHFEQFNPVQSRVFEIYEGNSNALIASSTASGKTAILEMYMSYELKVRKKKCIYVSPLKALAKEKEDDWRDPKHEFSKYKIALCTGDYQLTNNRIKELNEADIIILTYEMFSARLRAFTSEKSEFLTKVGVLGADEFHLIATLSRGSHAEVAMMKICDINPDMRLVLLSATLPNVEEVAGWVSEKITNRDSHCIISDYRPCKLEEHFETYYAKGRYEEKEHAKINKVCKIISENKDLKTIIFVHTKRTGQKMLERLQKMGIKAEYHNANLEKEQRIDLEKRFRNDPEFKILIATSTIAWGVDSSARRVIILGVHRGLDEVEPYDLVQMAGRAGRRSDSQGDVYYLIPHNEEQKWINKIKEKQPIKSVLLEKTGDYYKILAFHLVSEIHRGYVSTKADFYRWFERSLAHYQNPQIDESIIDETIDILEQYGAIKVDNGIYLTTAVGTIASMFYYSPFDVSDLNRNFYKLFLNNQQDNDIHLSVALGNIDNYKWLYANSAEKEEMGSFCNKVFRYYGKDNLKEGALKASFAYDCLLRGDSPPAFYSFLYGVGADLERTIEVLQALDTMAGKWGRHSYFRDLALRMKYGVASHLVPLCQLPNVGKARAEKLWNANIRTYSDVVNNVGKLPIIMKTSKSISDGVVASAKKLLLKEML